MSILRWAALSGICLAACGGAKPAENAKAAEPGHSPEAPVITCGPEKSYEYVASRYRCADGSNPLRGDLKRGSEARSGSSHALKGNHILDIYKVPCAGGTETVYVDMYGCPEYENMLVELGQNEAENEALIQSFQAGNFDEVITKCQNLPPGAPENEKVWCVALVPASLYGLKRDADALSALAAGCSHMPAATPDNDGRASILALTFASLATLAQKGKYESNPEQRAALIDSWLKACQVSGEQFQRTLESAQEQ